MPGTAAFSRDFLKISIIIHLIGEQRMGITFFDEKLKILCESVKERKRRLGEPAAKNLKTRLDELDAAACMDDMRDMPRPKPDSNPEIHSSPLSGCL